MLQLNPADLISKWGFSDGDICDEVIAAIVDSSVWAERLGPRGSDERYESQLWQYLSSHALLAELVRSYVVPKLPEKYRTGVRCVLSSHNPVLLFADDADDETLEEELSAIEPVEITEAQLLQSFERRFAHRSRGWLALFDALWVYSLIGDDTLPVQDPDCELLRDPHLNLCRYVDLCADQYCDDELLLAAQMLVGSELSVPSDGETVAGIVDSMLSSARGVLRDPAAAR